jgi:RNA methyltransferase, TrmH family
MPPAGPERIVSRDNPLVVQIRKLATDGAGYRKAGRVWLEGEHLGAALHARGVVAAAAVFTEEAWARPDLRALAAVAARTVLVPAGLFKALSALESPSALGFVLDLPTAPAIDPHGASVVLDRIQDAGNVGSILRSAAAFGFGQVLALKGTAALWSPKVLRAGMGAHFGLKLIEGLQEAELAALQVPLVATSSHATEALPTGKVPQPCAWVFGHEGQGVAPMLLARCALQLRIPQPGGEESLNVAAAAAVCLYESSR